MTCLVSVAAVIVPKRGPLDPVSMAGPDDVFLRSRSAMSVKMLSWESERRVRSDHPEFGRKGFGFRVDHLGFVARVFQALRIQHASPKQGIVSRPASVTWPIRGRCLHHVLVHRADNLMNGTHCWLVLGVGG